MGAKSQALLAVAINLAIASTPYIGLILLLSVKYIEKTNALLAVASFISLLVRAQWYPPGYYPQLLWVFQNTDKNYFSLGS